MTEAADALLSKNEDRILTFIISQDVNKIERFATENMKKFLLKENFQTKHRRISQTMSDKSDKTRSGTQKMRCGICEIRLFTFSNNSSKIENKGVRI